MTHASTASPATQQNHAALPENATGFRQNKKKPVAPPRPSSAIPEMSVGDVRRCLNQCRKAGVGRIRPEHLLWNGLTAGSFALSYLLGSYGRRKGRKGAATEAPKEEGEIAGATEANSEAPMAE